MPFLQKEIFKETHSQKLERISRINGLRHAIFTTNNDQYIGQWKDNIKHGKGQYISRKGRLYEGDWEKDLRDGFGVYAQRDDHNVFRLLYRGGWSKGKFSGDGFIRYPDNGIYEGSFKNGKRHGIGHMCYADGSYYDGDWWQDKRHGMGMFVAKNGNRYEGKWFNDMKHGHGQYFHLTTGQLQEGFWKNDNCAYSTIIDIPFRKSASTPTYTPLHKIELQNPDKVCEEGDLVSCGHVSVPSTNSSYSFL